MDHIQFTQSIISDEMDRLACSLVEWEEESPTYKNGLARMDLLAKAHQVIAEERFLTRTGRSVVSHWLCNNIKGVNPDDVSEAADQDFNGDLALVGALYMLVGHSKKVQRIWEDLYDEDEWEDQIVR